MFFHSKYYCPMKKIILIHFFVFLILTSNILGQEKMKMAILSMEAISVQEDVARTVSDLLYTELLNTGHFIIIERNKISSLLEEQGFQQSGCTETECAVEVGKILAVNRVLVGSVSRLGQSYIINARIVNVESGVLDFADKYVVNSESELVFGSEQFAKRLSARIRGEKIDDKIEKEREKIQKKQQLEQLKYEKQRSPSSKPRNKNFSERMKNPEGFFDVWGAYRESSDIKLNFNQTIRQISQSELGITGFLPIYFTSATWDKVANGTPYILGIRLGMFFSIFGMGVEMCYWPSNIAKQDTTFLIDNQSPMDFTFTTDDYLIVKTIPALINIYFLRLPLGSWGNIYAALGLGISINTWEMPYVKGFTESSLVFKTPSSFTDEGLAVSLPFGMRLKLGKDIGLFVEGRYMYNSFQPYRNTEGADDEISMTFFGVSAGLAYLFDM